MATCAPGYVSASAAVAVMATIPRRLRPGLRRNSLRLRNLVRSPVCSGCTSYCIHLQCTKRLESALWTAVCPIHTNHYSETGLSSVDHHREAKAKAQEPKPQSETTSPPTKAARRPLDGLQAPCCKLKQSSRTRNAAPALPTPHSPESTSSQYVLHDCMPSTSSEIRDDVP